MKRIFSYILIFVLFFDVISVSYFDSVYAASIEDPSTFDELGYILKHPGDLVRLVLSSAGVIFGGTGDFFAAHDEYTEKLQGWVDDGKIKVSTDSTVGGSGITIDASVTQEILDDMKQYVSDNGGYVLVPTVKASSITGALLPSVSGAYNAFINLLNSNNGIIGVYGSTRFGLRFFDFPDFPYYFVKSEEIWTSGVGYGTAYAYSDLYSDEILFCSYAFSSGDDIPHSFSDFPSDRAYKNFTKNILFADYFNALKPADRFNSSYGKLFLVTRTGFSVPLFDDLDSAIDYSVQNGLYFTGSNYDGVGKEITITADDIQKIQDGYYDGMYEQLQKLIQDNNVSPLDFDKLAELADQVLNSLGDIEQNTGESNTILQKILEVLNDMNSFLHTNITGSSDIDLSSLYSRLDSVVNELRSMSSTMGNISSSSSGSVDVDVGGIEDRLDGMASQLAREADTLESLNNAVDGTNSTLAELNSNISDLSSSLDEMYSALDGLKAGADNTDVVNKLNEVQEQIQLTNSRLDDVYDVIHKYLPLMSDILQELKDIHKAQVGSGFSDAALGVLQGLLDGLGGILGDIVIDPEVNIKKSFDDFSNAYKDTGAVEMLKKKFPFSIPWDMAFLVAFLSAPPEAPRFEFPLVFERLGINEVIVLDFSDFEVVSRISRTLLTLIYLIALMKFTTNIITKE